MAEKHPFWSLAVSDFFGSKTCASMTGLQQGVFLLALARSWDWDGLPSDPEEFRRALNIDPRWFKRHGKRVMDAFQMERGCTKGNSVVTTLKHHRQEKQRAEIQENKEQNVLRAKRAALARWAKHARSMPEACLPSPSPSDDKNLEPSGLSRLSGETKNSQMWPREPRPGLTESSLRFEEFWIAYPKRKGRRRGKTATFQLWCRLSEEDQRSAILAAKQYASGRESENGFARDPERFLQSDYWRDWVAEAEDEDTDRDEHGNLTTTGFKRLLAHVAKERDERRRREKQSREGSSEIEEPREE